MKENICFLFVIIVGVFQCGCLVDNRATVLKLHSAEISMNKKQVYFDEVSEKSAEELHGKIVHVRGKLVYEYDEAAIYPFYHESGFKPVWIHVGDSDPKLHQFLKEHDGEMTTIVGVLDTASYVDKFVYSSLLRDIQSVSVNPANNFENKSQSNEFLTER